MLKKIHLDIGATTIYVTHDQMEAMAIADRIVTMSLGEIQQVGTPEEVYHKPANMFVANFIGSPGMNFFKCDFDGKNTLSLGGDGKKLKIHDKVSKKILSLTKEKELLLGIRPEDCKLNEKKDEYGVEMNVLLVEELGPENVTNLQFGEKIIKVSTGPDVLPKTGKPVWVVPDPERLRIFDRVTENAIF